jgi:hypothetical protein
MLLSSDQISDIAAEIAGRLDHPAYGYLLLTFLIALCSSAAGAYIGAFFKQRGIQNATTAGFVEIKAQLAETTAIAEGTRNAIKAHYDERAELVRLYRGKIELALTLVFALTEWFELNRNLAYKVELPKGSGSPIEKLAAYHHIYFSKCSNDWNQLTVAHRDYSNWIVELYAEAATARARGTAFIASQHSADRYSEVLAAFMQAGSNYNNSVLANYGEAAGIPDRIVKPLANIGDDRSMQETGAKPA